MRQQLIHKSLWVILFLLDDLFPPIVYLRYLSDRQNHLFEPSHISFLLKSSIFEDGLVRLSWQLFDHKQIIK